jgi:tyrosine-protein phosphatase YwqE
MTDIHHHLLHGLEVGPSTIEESIQMCPIDFSDRMTRGGHLLS